jgi:methyltransferase (TIGR00027 family)
MPVRTRVQIPDLSNSIYVAQLRHIQSIHELPARRNPDTLVRYLLPLSVRVRSMWLGRETLATLRQDPFYYFLVARTKYYDAVLKDAVREGVQRIVSVGCGTDTRPLRFMPLLSNHGIRVLECDQADIVRAKEELTRRWRQPGRVSYLPLDLHDDDWSALNQWLGGGGAAPTLLMIEGVSPYVHADSFTRFLRLVAATLPRGSQVAYDYKIRGVKDDFGRSGGSEPLFRLSARRSEVAAFHEDLGLQLESFESSAELSARLLPDLVASASALFEEDALIRLRVAMPEESD